jgi:hypothetical protein
MAHSKPCPKFVNNPGLYIIVLHLQKTYITRYLYSAQLSNFCLIIGLYTNSELAYGSISTYSGISAFSELAYDSISTYSELAYPLFWISLWQHIRLFCISPRQHICLFWISLWQHIRLFWISLWQHIRLFWISLWQHICLFWISLRQDLTEYFHKCRHIWYARYCKLMFWLKFSKRDCQRHRTQEESTFLWMGGALLLTISRDKQIKTISRDKLLISRWTKKL